ncbi:MAG: trypsin-like serine protease [Acetobacteraceae bacterium]|nr:trypsin-like serine protease [Acetobacteraceae bacterium]
MPLDPTTYPYDTVVRITDMIGGSWWQGSGVLISPDEVLTASHVVYNSTGGTASNISVTPAYDAGTAPFGTATGISFHYNPIQDPGGTIALQQSQSDYAVIHLSRPFAGLGTMALQADYPGGSVNVTGYPGALNGEMENNPESVTRDPAYTLLDGTSIGAGSSGGPVWIYGANGTPAVVGVVSSADGGVGSKGFFTQLTAAAVNQIQAWVAQDDASPSTGLSVLDTTTGQTVTANAVPYTGPVSGLQEQFVDVTADNLNITVSTPNWFIHTGSGQDAIAVSSGVNVLDGGTGSNFLTGGSGTDTFFVDDRGATADIWSTVANFHEGDAATIWGVTPQDFSLAWADGQGAAGYTGLTLHAAASGQPTASLTLAGYTQADLTNGRLSVSFGTDSASGSAYMYVHGNG